MTTCRVCSSPIAAASYDASAPALTSMMSFIDMPTQVYVCEACGHAQCADLPDIKTFYDTTYRISLESDDHDQIFAMADDGTPLYRTDHQSAIGFKLLALPQGARILDYGAGKAGTLNKMCRARPDLHPHVFDVSQDYKAAWEGWVKPEDQSTYSVPDAWAGRFDAIISHFVIEHVAEPVVFLKTLHTLLAAGGQLLLSMPDVAANPGDMTVADHLNHFSKASLHRALALSGFRLDTIDSDAFPGAFFMVATRLEQPVAGAPDQQEVADAVAKANEICAFWKDATKRMDGAAKRFSGKRAAVYGSGFYGSWISSRIEAEVDFRAFLDQNPKLQGSTHFNRPVLSPSGLGSDIDVVFVGLNPLKARAAIAGQATLHRPGLDLVWIDG
ncbi:methyltransferase domain-containing protein [Pararhizobium sp.]|uniref:methyltransferase domain-containing protein n=1 Tax=Pararhizobium sp. TaxID=1977563 RepID=UPI00272683BA|nr:methyltransferase domain-containing protein [Pararhizobium sp.]MDO9416274.1 methyltransferase domain-containing protein [Pararhizobium sp.]